jgi:hypothetical protein
MSEGNPTPTPPKPPKPAPAPSPPRPSPPVLKKKVKGEGAPAPSPGDQRATGEGLGGFATVAVVLGGIALGVGACVALVQLAPVRKFLGLPEKKKTGEGPVTVTQFNKP